MIKLYQKNFTITEEQRKYAVANLRQKNIRSIAKDLGVTYNKLHNNLRLMRLVNTRVSHKKLDTSEYFDIDDFANHYKY